MRGHGVGIIIGAVMTEFDGVQFVKILGRLGSDNDSEVVIAARKVSELLKSGNLTWNQIINAPQSANDDYDDDVFKKIACIESNIGIFRSDDAEKFEKIRSDFLYEGKQLNPDNLRLMHYFMIRIAQRNSENEDLGF